jgi:hypothetical protein
MKLFLLKLNRCDYEQYDAFVVASKTSDDAICFIKDRYRTYEVDFGGGHTIYEINPDALKKSACILGSLRAL